MTTPDRAARRAAAAAVDLRTVAASSSEAQLAMTHYFTELDRRFTTGFATAEQSAQDVEALSPPTGVFVVGGSDGEPVACGGVQTIAVPDAGGEPTTCAEIKRMWVHEDWRGSGLGSRLLRELERQASALGHRVVRLDTNDTLTEAIGMYRRAGYREIDRYNDNPYARLWFEKILP